MTKPDPDDILKMKTFCDYCTKEITDLTYTFGRRPYIDLHYECYIKLKSQEGEKK